VAVRNHYSVLASSSPFHKDESKVKTFNNLHVMCAQCRGNPVRTHSLCAWFCLLEWVIPVEDVQLCTAHVSLNALKEIKKTLPKQEAIFCCCWPDPQMDHSSNTSVSSLATNPVKIRGFIWGCTNIRRFEQLSKKRLSFVKRQM